MIQKTYKIEIEELLQMVVDVEADNRQEALQKVKEMYGYGDIVLNENDLKEVVIREFTEV